MNWSKIGILAIALLGCAASGNQGKAPIRPLTPLPVDTPPEALTLESSETPRDIGAVAHAPEVDVSTVTTAWFQGLESVSPCVSVHMGQADAPDTTDPIVLSDGDELSVQLADEADSLDDGVYDQQITIEGVVPQHERNGALVSEKRGILALTYHPYEMKNGVFTTISDDEYRSRLANQGDTPATDMTPKNCASPTAPATVSVMRADGK